MGGFPDLCSEITLDSTWIEKVKDRTLTPCTISLVQFEEISLWKTDFFFYLTLRESEWTPAAGTYINLYKSATLLYFPKANQSEKLKVRNLISYLQIRKDPLTENF